MTRSHGGGHPVVPDFLDSRLKRAGMTKRKGINCGILDHLERPLFRYDRGITDQYNSTVTYGSLAFF